MKQEGRGKRANVGLEEEHASWNIPNSFNLLVNNSDFF